MPAPSSPLRYIGVDLGTTHSSMAYVDALGNVLTIANAEGENVTPSAIMFESDGQVIVGREARRLALVEPERVADSPKRDLGQRFYHRPVAGEQYSPVTLSALILQKLKQDAQAAIGPVAGAVITVPAYFDAAQRQATMAAGDLAGLSVLDIVNEPTAAALAYACRDFLAQGGTLTDLSSEMRKAPAWGQVVVYDLGGGTFDVTVLQIEDGDFTVLATDGDGHLGGKDWDERIVKWAAQQFRSAYGGDPLDDPHSLAALTQHAEAAKIELSRRPRTRLVVSHAGKSLRLELTREQLEQMTADLLARTEQRLAQVIRQVGSTWDAVDEVLAVGGSSRMPAVLRMLERVTAAPPNVAISPKDVVCHGAAIHAALRTLEARRQRPAAAKPAPTPDVSEETVVVEPLSESSDRILRKPPAAPSADLYAPTVVERLQYLHMTNVNAHSMGVYAETLGGRERNTILIPRNTRLPVRVTRQFGTVRDDQDLVRVVVLEGESLNAKDCRVVGICDIRDLPRGLPRGSPVYVSFIYDSSGLLHVQAVEASTGKSATTVIRRGEAVDDATVAKAREQLARLQVS